MSSRDTRRARRQRTSQLDPHREPDLFALRDAFVADPDAGVRAAALLRLHGSGAARLLPYVRDACADPALQVREAAFVALARARDSGAFELVRQALMHERSFRVRRMAVLLAGRALGSGGVPLIELAGRDPFWRVRVAARRVAGSLGVALDTSGIELVLPVGDLHELHDEDPAVVAARLLEARAEIAPGKLVGALGESHAALRRIAVVELGARGSLNDLREALGWLVDERAPYGPNAAEAALRRAGARAGELALQVLDELFEPAPGMLAWAIRSAPHAIPWSRLERWLHHDDVRVRRVAAARVPESAPERALLLSTLRQVLANGDDASREAAAAWLWRSASKDARFLLADLEAANQPTRVRHVIAEARAELRRVEDLRLLLADQHGAVRAHAVAALARLGALLPAERAAAEQDADPWLREAALGPQSALAAVADTAPRVRRAAVDLLDGPSQRAAWAAGVSSESEPDPWLRARAASVLAEVATASAARQLLRLSRDADLGVRSAAHGALTDHRQRVAELLASAELTPPERIAAHTLLYAGQTASLAGETDPNVRAHLALLNDLAAGRTPAALLDSAQAPASGGGPSRPLGKTGLYVNPFGLSGAHNLSFDDFVLAEQHGVSLFFWEPSHLELARFLRSRGRNAVISAGTYHADRAAIERDVVRALRALRREALDIFLAFWTRSSARLDETTGILTDLARRGLVRAVGISTHDRALAVAAVERGLDVVMVRHNAAHRGAESSVFPACLARSTAVLTFSNLCYGRMLHRSPAPLSRPVTAPDCYRYSLSQPGVSACIAAPRRHSELLENLAVARSAGLSSERLAELRLHGDHVYARSKAWSAETWSAPPAPPSGVTSARCDEELADWVERPASLGSDSW